MYVVVGVGRESQLLRILRSCWAGSLITLSEWRGEMEVIANSDVFIPVMKKVLSLEGATNLKLIQQFGVGLESVDIPAATRAGILVANVPSPNISPSHSLTQPLGWT